jgi:hypothetical protein
LSQLYALTSAELNSGARSCDCLAHEGYCHRHLLDAIRYLVAGGISWRAMPADFPCLRPGLRPPGHTTRSMTPASPATG